MKTQPVFVIGHKRPDTDSVVSSIAYAALKSSLGEKNIIPAITERINPETRFVLKRFGIKTPKVIKDLYLRVEDVMSSPPVTVEVGSPVKEVLDIIRRENFNMIPITKDRVLAGIIDLMSLASILIQETEVKTARKVDTNVQNILTCLNGSLMTGDPNARFPNGNFIVGAMAAETIPKKMKGFEGYDNIVLLGNREDAQKAVLEAGVRCLVITGGHPVSKPIADLAKETNTIIISSPYDTISSVRLIKLSASVETLMERNPATVSPEMRVIDAKKTIIKTPSRSLPVVDDLWRVVGVVTGTDLLKARGKGVILVDHNELFQAVDGIEEAEVLEVVDHHRIGDLQSTLPISFTGEPVGATSTLIQEKYERSFVSPTKEIAGILLAGILSDTLLLRSPTTTEKDKEIAEKLSLIAGVNMNEFGMEMFRHASSIAGKEIKDVIASNFKEYEIEGRMIGIGQSETIDGEGLLKRRRDFEKELKRIKNVHKLDLAIMVISDVIKEGSFILSSGDQDVIQQAFGTAEKTHGAIFLKGVLSRKKQILPAIGQALKAYDDAL